MCSYRRINNSYACANGKTLNGLRKTELGFQVTPLLSQDVRLLLPRVAAAVLSGSRRGSTGYKTIVPDGAISGHLGDPEDTWCDHWHQNERYAGFGGCGSGATTPAHAISPFEALETRAHGDGRHGAPVVDPASEVHTVFRNVLSCEAYNQPALQDKYTDDLVKSVAADSCNKIIHDSVHRRALCGQELLASLLYDESISPRAKLPPLQRSPGTRPTIPVRRPSTPERRRRVALFPQSGFSKGRAAFDHGHFDKEDTTPRLRAWLWPELINTTFCPVQRHSPARCLDGGGNLDDEYPTGTVIPGGLRGPLGHCRLYVGILGGAPRRQLRRPTTRCACGRESRSRPTFALTQRGLSVRNVEAQRWQLQRGTYAIEVSTSSRDLPLKLSLEM
ncbi:hypothetical protein MY3296_009873 [Beauveria thailandica]